MIKYLITRRRTKRHGFFKHASSRPLTANSKQSVHPNKGGTPLIAHIIFRLDVGGLENGLVNLINHMPQQNYRHAIICLQNYSSFRFRIHNPDIKIYALQKKEGKDIALFIRLWRLLRRLKPDVVHTRNLAAIECQFIAWSAGIRCRVHGEHGWDVQNLNGRNRKQLAIRRTYKILVNRYIALSKHIENYLIDCIGVSKEKIKQIYNGVDTKRFCPNDKDRRLIFPKEFDTSDTVVIGTVGRLQAVKDQATLIKAFLYLLESKPGARQRLRLVLVGDGPLRERLITKIKDHEAEKLIWLTGERSDVPELLRAMDIFVLPSLAEGISNTILEAMATGLPVIAPRVGGNPELVEEGKTGVLVSASDHKSLARAMSSYIENKKLRQMHGNAGRARVISHFSLRAMVEAYSNIYSEILVDKNRVLTCIDSSS